MNEGYLQILNSISSSNPTPGGGSVAALTLAHGHSLSVMVSRLTVNSDKWIDGHTVANNIISQSEKNISKQIFAFSILYLFSVCRIVEIFTSFMIYYVSISTTKGNTILYKS